MSNSQKVAIIEDKQLETPSRGVYECHSRPTLSSFYVTIHDMEEANSIQTGCGYLDKCHRPIKLILYVMIDHTQYQQPQPI